MFAALTQTSMISNLDKLISSLEKFWVCKPDVFVINFTNNDLPKYNLNIYEIRVENLLPLSVARNRLISTFNLLDDTKYSHFVFLDDDCWFEEEFDSRKMVQDENYIGIARSPSGSLLHSLKLSEFTCAISINMIIAAKFLDYFDENLGLGTVIGAGEDWGYYLLLSRRQKFLLTQNYQVLHLAFKDKIKKLTYSQLYAKAESEATAVKYLARAYNVTAYKIIVKSLLKSIYPFYGIRFMFKNMMFLLHYAR